MKFFLNSLIYLPCLKPFSYPQFFLKRTDLNYTSCHCRFFSNKNPFQKKKYYHGTPDAPNEVDRICITILGNGALGQPRCIGLFTNSKTYLFNCGEGVGRLLREYEGNFNFIKHAFITQNDWTNISGLPDIHITHDAYGVYNLKLFGPPGIENFNYLITSSISRTKLVKKNAPSIDDNLEVKSISITDLRPSKKHEQGNKREVHSYCIKVLEKPAKLSPEKLVECDVPMGPHLLKLRNGEDVVLPSGKIIHPSDVIESFNKEEILIVADCPSESFLWPFVTSNEFSQYQLPSDSACKVSYVFHFSPSHIINTTKYQEWMHRFHSKTQHVILNSSCSNISSETVYKTQSFFHHLHPEIFRLLPKSETKHQGTDVSTPVIYAPPMLQINLRPERSLNWSNVIDSKLDNYLKETKLFPGYQEEINKLNSLKTSKPEYLTKGSQIYPEVIFLGTSSSTSSAYRNVSAILLKVSSSNSVLLDCGEGAFLQFVRYFGAKEVDDELCKISCIFVSHLHTDHYMGLFLLIQERIKAFQRCGYQYETISLILPHRIRHIFKQFCVLFENLLPKVKIFSCRSLTEGGTSVGNLNAVLRDIKIETVPVIHCTDAYGIVFEKDLEWKIVYSGDTAPCQKLIDAGENCTLLIHEASIEDGCTSEALARKHSTPSQVIEVSEKMNAKHTIMTHFSKRYLAIPVFSSSNNKTAAYAFDFMKVQLHQLDLLPHFLPATRCLFQDQLENHSERTSYYVNFEHSFLKTLKQRSNSGHSSD